MESYQARLKRTEEVRASLKIRLSEMKLRLKRRRERFHLECSSFIDEELNLKRQLNDSGCLLEEDFAKRKVESLRNIKYLQNKFDEQLKKQNKERSKKRKEKHLLDETILSIVDISTFKRTVSKERFSATPSRTSTPIFNQKNLRDFISKQNKKSNSIKKPSSKRMRPSLVANSRESEGKYFNINENNYYNYSINLNNFENKMSQYSSLMSTQSSNMPLEFQDFGDFKIWYV